MNNQSLYCHAKTVIPGGTQLLSKRPEQMAPDQWPPYFRAAKGCTITDLDGRKYTDFSSCGIGGTLLGFNDDDVSEAVIKVIRDGSFSTLNPPEEVMLADRLCAIHPWACCARFARCGGETAAIAVRIARAFRDRSKVIISGYHGWQDWYLASNLGNPDALGKMWLSGLSPHGVPKELGNTAFPLIHGDFERLETLLREHGNDLAAIICEPCRHELPKPGFLEALRRGCDQYGAMLIFDEISIGWRYRFGGSHLDFGVDPDMAIFSKAMGNGHPIGAVVGNEKMLDAGRKTFLSSTYWTERTGPAAALAAIDKMERTGVSAHVNDYGNEVMRLWKSVAETVGLPIKITSSFGCLASFAFDVPGGNLAKTLYVQWMLDHGILASPAFYPMLTHGKKEFALFADAVKDVFGRIAPLAAAGESAMRAALRGPEAHSGFGRLLK